MKNFISNKKNFFQKRQNFNIFYKNKFQKNNKIFIFIIIIKKKKFSKKRQNF